MFLPMGILLPMCFVAHWCLTPAIFSYKIRKK